MKVHIDPNQKDAEEQYTNENGQIGINFADMGKDVKNKKVLKLTPYEEKWRHRTVCPGLNLEGTCLNQSCKVFEKKVWVQKGYGMFRIAQQLDSAECPLCKQLVPPQTVISLGYTSAAVKVVGKKHGEPKRCQFDDKQQNGQLIKFEGYDGQTVHWTFLNLTVSKLSNS